MVVDADGCTARAAGGMRTGSETGRGGAGVPDGRGGSATGRIGSVGADALPNPSSLAAGRVAAGGCETGLATGWMGCVPAA